MWSRIMENIIEVCGVNKYFGEEHVLKDVSHTFEKGKIHGIVGNNGSGKTVLMKCICGFLKPDSGVIYVNHKQVGKETDFPEDIGIIIETPGFLPHLSGTQNLKILASLQKKANALTIRTVLEQVGLDPDMKKPVGKYSLGMRQRLGFAQALMEDPSLLILDEPLNGLDPSGVLDFRMLVRSLAAGGTSVLISSHQLAEMELMCSRLIIIESGFIVSIKTLKELTGESDDIPVHYRLDVNDAARALKLLTDNGFSAETAESGLNVYMTRLQSAEAARLLVENNIAVYGLTAVKKTLSDAFLEATGKRRRAKKK